MRIPLLERNLKGVGGQTLSEEAEQVLAHSPAHFPPGDSATFEERLASALVGVSEISVRAKLVVHTGRQHTQG